MSWVSRFLGSPVRLRDAQHGTACSRYWADVGSLDPDPLRSDSPVRFRTIRTHRSLIIATDGLAADHGVELYLERQELQHLSPSEITKSPAFQILEQTSWQINQIQAQLKSRGAALIDLLLRDARPNAWIDGGGKAGALVGLPPRCRLGKTQLLSLTLLYTHELSAAQSSTISLQHLTDILSGKNNDLRTAQDRPSML